MKKAIILSFFYFLTLSLSFGQTNQVKTIESKKQIKDYSLINNTGIQTASQPADESPYFGYDNKIKDISISNFIPTGFPTKEGYTNKETYRIAINKWIKENPSAIKPQFINSEITDK